MLRLLRCVQTSARAQDQDGWERCGLQVHDLALFRNPCQVQSGTCQDLLHGKGSPMSSISPLGNLIVQHLDSEQKPSQFSALNEAHRDPILKGRPKGTLLQLERRGRVRIPTPTLKRISTLPGSGFDGCIGFRGRRGFLSERSLQ